MRRSILKFEILALFAILIFNCYAYANPLPASPPDNYGSGSPINYNEINAENKAVHFISEYIQFRIWKEDIVYVNASYLFNNPTNKSVKQEILLPFEKLPKHITAFGINEFGSFYIADTFDELDKISIEFDEKIYECIIFDLDFSPNETIALNVQYEESYQKSQTGSFSFENSYTYLAKTGRSWNKTINATFIFRINKELYSSGLSGFEIHEEGPHIVASKSYTNWTCDEDIKIKWIYEDYSILPCLLAVMLIFITIMIVAIFFIRRIKKGKKDQN